MSVDAKRNETTSFYLKPDSDVAIVFWAEYFKWNSFSIFVNLRFYLVNRAYVANSVLVCFSDLESTLSSGE